MRRGAPVIAEVAEVLKAQMQGERHPGKRQRLHMLYLFASGQAKERQEAAGLLGLHRNTVGEWVAQYEREGLTGLLAVKARPGLKPALSLAQQAQLQEALAKPEGFSSYKAVQAWVAETFGVQMEYQALHKLVRYKLGAKLKVARPTNPKKTRKR